MLLFWLTVPNYDYYRDILLHCFEIQGDEYTAHYLKRRECQSHIQKYVKISSFWKSWLPTVRFHFLLLGLKYSNFRFRYISKIKDIFKNTHINPSVSLEKKSRDTVPLAIKKNTTQNQIWFFLNKVFSDGHMKNKTIKNVMSWHLFRKNQQ